MNMIDEFFDLDDKNKKKEKAEDKQLFELGKKIGEEQNKEEEGKVDEKKSS